MTFLFLYYYLLYDFGKGFWSPQKFDWFVLINIDWDDMFVLVHWFQEVK